MKNRKVLEFISKKMIEDIKLIKGAPKSLNPNIPWYDEDKVIITRQMVTETFENESQSLTKIDHHIYFRRRFLKSSWLSAEVNELRANESAQKNKDSFQRSFGDVILPNGNLDEAKTIEKLSQTKLNFKFSKDYLNGPVLLMYNKKVVFSIRLDKTRKIPK
jgi:hypothetical protein